MQVETVTTEDRGLLHHVRQTLAESTSVLLCVAFVQQRGVHLLEDEMKALRRRKAELRLLVTTTFATTDDAALGLAAQLGARVKILNPGKGSYHPKVYLGLGKDSLQAVVGSANLTGGLATNVEAAVWMKGRPSDEPLARVHDFTERLWDSPRTELWHPRAEQSDSGRETFEDDLYSAVTAAVATSRDFMTLGSPPRRNRVVDLRRDSALIETARSRAEPGGASEVPAWMFNLAWDYLRTQGELSNTVLLNELRVHRSSAVCAILARLPGVERAPGRKIVLRWNAH